MWGFCTECQDFEKGEHESQDEGQHESQHESQYTGLDGIDN